MLPYQKDLRDYYERKNLFHTGTIPVEKRSDHEVLLSMENVSFKYPGTEQWVLRNINLTLDMKKKHAIVGPNGAGKTTFILLLCRLFELSEGRILLNGVDIRKYDYEEYLSLFSVVFQDFQLFALTLGENVSVRLNYDANRVQNDLIRSGFGSPLQRLESADGLDTLVMNPRPDKAHFSGGEQQKIAIARALYQDGSVMILDEPTAALDPLSEAEIYTHLNDLIQDKTTVFISHRMSSCRFCSDIIVLDEGKVVERGTHENLLQNEALYYEMWNAQAEYYQ